MCAVTIFGPVLQAVTQIPTFHAAAEQFHYIILRPSCCPEKKIPKRPFLKSGLAIMLTIMSLIAFPLTCAPLSARIHFPDARST